MLLILRVHSYRNQALADGSAQTFSSAGGTLGRSADCDLVLDDPGKYISRVHARVSQRGGLFYLTDAGSNPSLVNDIPLGRNREVALGDGDSIVVGDYLLISALQEDAIEPAAPAAVPQPDTAPPPAPFLPLFVPPPAVVPAPPAPPLVAAQAGLFASAPVLPTGAPDALAGARILAAAPGAGDAGDALADPLGLNLLTPVGARPPSFGLAESGAALAPAFRGAESDHVSPELQALPPLSLPPSPPPSAFAIPADYDPLAGLVPPRAGAGDAAALSAAPSAPAALPPAPAAVIPAAPSAGPAGPQPPAPSSDDTAPRVAAPRTVPPPHGAPRGDDGAVLQSLLDGLGLPQLVTQRSPEQLARLAGEMLRAATGGTMAVLMARALTKRESNIDMTMIAPRSNNPLKFFPDADAALTQMFSADSAGYLPAGAAFAGAFDDLKAHELAVIAGMRAALAAVVQRFDPAGIERRLARPGRLDRLLPSARKARMWDRLAELYGELARDADEDLQRLFGEKFSVAYDAQVTRLRGER
jgi:FHA domain-containing protein/type VI secretion system protein